MTTARRRRIAVGAALAVLGVDLMHLALAPTDFHHERSAPWLLLTGALVAAILVVAPRAPSRALALAGGVAAGGALGNVVAAVIWSAGVPDPLVVCAMVTAALVTIWANRGRLRDPV
jgi:hypothetical protein